MKHFCTILLILSFRIYAVDGHAHLPTYAAASDFAAVTENIFALTSGSLRLSKLIPGNDQAAQENNLMIFLRSIGFNAQAIVEFMAVKGLKATFRELCFYEGFGGEKAAADNLTRLLSINPTLHDRVREIERLYRARKPMPAHHEETLQEIILFLWNITPHDEHIITYTTMEAMRLQLLLSLDLSSVVLIFKRMVDLEVVANYDHLDLTVPVQFFESDAQMAKLLAIKEIFAKKDAKVRFFLSITRRAILGEGEFLTPAVEVAIARKIISGFDLTGSISEARFQFISLDYERVARRLMVLMGISSDHNWEFKVHGWEAANEGTFYEAFRRALQLFDRRLRIRIAHSNMITPIWTDFFFAILKRGIVKIDFDDNFVSNHYLVHPLPIVALRNTSQVYADKIAHGIYFFLKLNLNAVTETNAYDPARSNLIPGSDGGGVFGLSPNALVKYNLRLRHDLSMSLLGLMGDIAGDLPVNCEVISLLLKAVQSVSRKDISRDSWVPSIR